MFSGLSGVLSGDSGAGGAYSSTSHQGCRTGRGTHKGSSRNRKAPSRALQHYSGHRHPPASRGSKKSYSSAPGLASRLTIPICGDVKSGRFGRDSDDVSTIAGHPIAPMETHSHQYCGESHRYFEERGLRLEHHSPELWGGTESWGGGKMKFDLGPTKRTPTVALNNLASLDGENDATRTVVAGLKLESLREHFAIEPFQLEEIRDEAANGAATDEGYQRRLETLMGRVGRVQRIGKAVDDNAVLRQLHKSRPAEAKKRDFQLLIWIAGIRKPLIWRRVVVPGNTRLFDLHDRILAPIFGWCRNYHAFYFMQAPFARPMDELGVVFGPKKCLASDMQHFARKGAQIIDAKKVVLADVVSGPSDRLVYQYDLGDAYDHVIHVEAVTPSSKSKGRIRLLDGEGCPIPEDAGSPWKYARLLSAITADTDSHDCCEWANAHGECQQAANFGSIGLAFPFWNMRDINVKMYRRRLQHALRSEPSPMDMSNMSSGAFRAFLEGRAPTKADFPKFRLSRVTLRTKNTSCANCGSRDGKKHRCSACCVDHYCSRECQMRAWKEGHRRVCCRLKRFKVES